MGENMLNRKINFFISVVENGSFSRAAKQFYLSQSAISQQIIQLEEELGVCLFDRSGYRPILTESGRYYYNECKKLLDQYKRIEEMTKTFDGSKNRKLRIGITGPLENKHLPIIINEYKKEYSDVIIELKKIKFESGVNQLVEEKLDICFGITNDFKGKENINTVNLLKHKVCVVCSMEHPWSNRKSVNSIEISHQPIISFSKSFGKGFYLDFIKSFKQDGITPNIVQEVDELEELLLAVKINQGIALVSREVVDEDSGICILNIDNTHHHADFCIGYLKKNDNEFIKALVDITVKYFGDIISKNNEVYK